MQCHGPLLIKTAAQTFPKKENWFNNQAKTLHINYANTYIIKLFCSSRAQVEVIDDKKGHLKYCKQTLDLLSATATL